MPPTRNPLRARGQATVDSGVFASPSISYESSKDSARGCDASEITHSVRCSSNSDDAQEGEDTEEVEILGSTMTEQEKKVMLDQRREYIRRQRKWWMKGTQRISKRAKKVMEKVKAVVSRTYQSNE
jgi:hypothetical protein